MERTEFSLRLLQPEAHVHLAGYILAAVVMCSAAFARAPVRWNNLPRPRWQWAARGRIPSSSARASGRS